MHIVHYNLTTTTQHGGVETFVWELAERQQSSGHQVTIIGGAAAPKKAVLRSIRGVRVVRYPFVDRMTWRSLRPLRRHFELTKMLERLSMLPGALPMLLGSRADLVHIHKPYDFVIAPIVHAIGARFIYHGHGEDFYPGDQVLARGVDGMLSCSTYNAGTLMARYGRSPTVVFNGFDPGHFTPQPVDQALRAQLAQPDERIVLVLGRLQPWKGVQYAIGALPLLPAHHKVRLLIGGEGVYRPALERLVAELGVEDRVQFLGVVPHRDVRRYYTLADIIVGTSFASETFGMVLCEALACARPVVASDWAGFQEVVLDGDTGWIVPSQDPAALAAAIVAVFDDPEEARRRAERGRAHVHRLFTWDAVAKRVEAAYRQVV